MRNGLRMMVSAAIVLALSSCGRLLGAESPAELARRPLRDQGEWSRQLKYDVIIEELAITADQSRRLTELETELDAAAEEEHRREKELSEQQLAAKREAFWVEARAAAEVGIRLDDLPELEQDGFAMRYQMRLEGTEFDRRLEKILKPEQTRRLAELACRVMGPQLFSKDYRSLFDLTLEQKLKCDELLDRHQKETEEWVDELFKLVDDELNRDRTSAAALSASHRRMRARERLILEKMVGILSERQRSTFDKLRGKELDLTRFDKGAVKAMMERLYP